MVVLDAMSNSDLPVFNGRHLASAVDITEHHFMVSYKVSYVASVVLSDHPLRNHPDKGNVWELSEWSCVSVT